MRDTRERKRMSERGINFVKEGDRAHVRACDREGEKEIERKHVRESKQERTRHKCASEDGCVEIYSSVH